MNNDSYIEYGQGGTTFSGPDAVNFFRAATLVSALRLYGEHRIGTNRHLTPTRLLQLATEYTKKPYKRGEYLQAAADVHTWAQTMKAALPAIVRGTA